MFSWLKAKPPKPEWEITCDGYGVYRVRSNRELPSFALRNSPAYYFALKEYANIQQAENAIQDYLIMEQKNKRKVVKTL